MLGASEKPDFFLPRERNFVGREEPCFFALDWGRKRVGAAVSDFIETFEKCIHIIFERKSILKKFW